MAWWLIVLPRAEKDLASLPRRDREAVRAALDRIALQPGRADLKKLSGHADRWRLRVGRWRVILRLDNATGHMNVLRVLSRDRAYRD
jgi:mRNA interferase RelE/StbE